MLQPPEPVTVPSPEKAMLGRASGRIWPGRSPRTRAVPTSWGATPPAAAEAPPPAADAAALTEGEALAAALQAANTAVMSNAETRVVVRRIGWTSPPGAR